MLADTPPAFAAGSRRVPGLERVEFAAPPPLNKRRSEEVKCGGVQLSIREPHLSNQLSFILESVALQNGIGLINSPEPLEEKGPLIEWGCILI